MKFRSSYNRHIYDNFPILSRKLHLPGDNVFTVAQLHLPSNIQIVQNETKEILKTIEDKQTKPCSQ